MNRKAAVDTALAALARRPHTASELEEKLDRAGFPLAERDAAVARMRALGYLDDDRVVSRRAEKYLEAGNSRALTVERLLARGVPAGVATRAVDGVMAEHRWTDETLAAALVARERLAGVKGARRLTARGFGVDLAMRLLGLDPSGAG